MDLLERLLGGNYIIPDDIEVMEISEDWFSYKETDTAKELVDELVSNPDCPLEYSPGPVTEVWLLDQEDTEDFIKELRDIPWYEL
ncbi:vWA domain-containing protein [Halorussus amylolyticus]|uniref:hypothetical protein n=1 Tax=Halorussus amylolyticus TaxID=1126242 RepID=UPI00104EF309|nr:hypothetical protein [Halorussus amylolyticus]